MRESEPEKRRKSLIYIRLTNVQEHLYPHFSVSFGRLFCEQTPVMGFRTSATETRHIPARATGNQWIEGFPAPIYLLIGLYFHTLRKDTRGGAAKQV